MMSSMSNVYTHFTSRYRTPVGVCGRVVKTQTMCTLGPSTTSVQALSELLEAGMSAARINFSHSTHQQYDKITQNLRLACEQTGKFCAIVMDTRGPEIRIGEFQNGRGIQLKKGQEFVFVSNHVLGDEHQVTLRSWTLWQHVVVGDQLMLDYGLISCTITKVETRKITVVVDNASFLGPRKQVVVRQKKDTHELDAFRASLLSYQDTEDIAFAIEHELDIICVSGVTKAADLDEIRALPNLTEADILLFAKIDNLSATKHLY